MRQHGAQRVGCIVRAHGDQSHIVFAFDLLGKRNVHSYVESTVRHVHLEAVFSDRGDVLSIDIDKAYVVTGARQLAANDPANGAGADHNHASAHSHLRYGTRPTYAMRGTASTDKPQRHTLEQTRWVT